MQEEMGMKGRWGVMRARYVLIWMLLALSCSSNPGAYHRITPEALSTVNTKGDRVFKAKMSSPKNLNIE